MNCHMGSEGVDFFGISECDKGQARQEEWCSETHGLFCEHPKQEVIQVTDFQRGGDDTQTWAESSSLATRLRPCL